MKKLTAIGLLSLFALLFAGFYGYFGVRLMTIRKEMKAQLALLPETELEKIVVTLAEFESIDLTEGEIERNGKMYDIAKIQKHGNQYILFALHDEHEDNLLALLDEIVKLSGNDKKPVPSQLLQFLTLLFIPVDNSFTPASGQCLSGLTAYVNFYYSVAGAIPTPPPWG